MKDGGEDAVQKWRKRVAPPYVDRSSTCCRPVDSVAGAVPKEERERGKGERKSRDFGAEASLSPNGAKTKVFIG